jgi:hypothetical protein
MKNADISKRFLKSGREVSEENLYQLVKLFHRRYPCHPFIFYEEINGKKVRVEVFSTPAVGNEWEYNTCRCGVTSYFFKHHLLHHYHKEFQPKLC